VLLVVEVAATSLKFDRDTKFPLYERHGIPEMWLVDVGGRRLVRHRGLQQSSYRLVDEPDVGVALELPGLSGVTVDLRRLFG
jgi:Uma2 family endonuclease